MTRPLWLHAIALVLSSCCTAAAQQSVLVEHDHMNDPCSRFKMRVLMPASTADYKLMIKEPAKDFDHKMVWNPCREDGPLLAIAPVAPIPSGRGGYFAQKLFKLQLPPEDEGHKKPSEFLRPRSPSAFELMRRQR